MTGIQSLSPYSNGQNMERPLVVNGFWPEVRRPDDESAAEKIPWLGDFKIAFSPQQDEHIPEYDEGSVVNWIIGKLGAAEDEPAVQPPVELRVLPRPELRDKVAEVMDRRGRSGSTAGVAQ